MRLITINRLTALIFCGGASKSWQVISANTNNSGFQMPCNIGFTSAAHSESDCILLDVGVLERSVETSDTWQTTQRSQLDIWGRVLHVKMSVLMRLLHERSGSVWNHADFTIRSFSWEVLRLLDSFSTLLSKHHLHDELVSVKANVWKCNTLKYHLKPKLSQKKRKKCPCSIVCKTINLSFRH